MTPETMSPIGPGAAADPPACSIVYVPAPLAVAAAVAAAILVLFNVIEAVYIVTIPPLKTFFPKDSPTSSGVLPLATSAKNYNLIVLRNSTTFSFDGGSSPDCSSSFLICVYCSSRYDYCPSSEVFLISFLRAF